MARHVLVEQHSEEDSASACVATLALHHGKRLTLVNLRDQLDAVPLPAICQWKGNHWVVLHGFQGSKVVIDDPAVGIRQLSRDEFLAGWGNGVMLLLEPDDVRLAEHEVDQRRGGDGGGLAWKLITWALLLWAPVLGWDMGQQFFRGRQQVVRTVQLPELIQPKPASAAAYRAASDPLSSRQTELLLVSPGGQVQIASSIEPVAPEFAASQAARAEEITSPNLLAQLKGADALGGEVNLANRQDPPMPAAALAERMAFLRSGDPMRALPRHWRGALRQEAASGVRIMQAEVIRLPAAHLQKAEDIPLAVRDNGEAVTLVPASSAASQQLVETWASRQPRVETGAMKPVLLKLEPLPVEVSAQAAPKPLSTPPSQPSAP